MPRPLAEIEAEFRSIAQSSAPYVPPAEYGWMDRLGAGLTGYKANLLGLGEAVGLDLADSRRLAEVDAQAMRQRASAALDIPTSYTDVDGVGSFLRYAGGLAADSAPYLGEALVGGGVGGLAARGLGTGARALARTAGAVGASYPSAVGDVLSNQRDQAGVTDGATAAALGVPYALANAFGIEGALARGVAMKSGIQALDDMTGLRGGLARTGASMARGALTEAPAETFQEAMNQYGRMAVDPNETFFNERSNERFAESAVGGGVLGGLFGGGMGGWRRSNDWYARQAQPSLQPPPQSPSQSLDLLDAEVPKAGEQFSLFGSPYTQPMDDAPPAPRSLDELLAEQDRIRGETMDVLRQKNAAEVWFHGPEGQLQNAAASNEPGQRWEEMASQFNRRLSELQAQAASVSAQLEPYQRQMAFGDQGGQMGLDFSRPQFPQPISLLGWNQKREEPMLVLPNGQAVSQEQFAAFPPVVQNYLTALRQPRVRPLGLSAPMLPGVININSFGQAGATDTQNQTLLADTTDLGTELARLRIAQGFVGAPAAPQGKGTKGKDGKAAPAAPAAPAQTQANDWPNRALWTQYGLPPDSTKLGRTVFDQAVQAKANDTLDAEGFERVVEGLRKHTNSGRAVLAAETNRVATQKEQDSKPSMAPKAPKQPAVVVPAPAPAAGENQLLVQGAPNVSGPNLAGQPTGGSSVAGRVDAGGSVASAGPNPAATVGSADPARGVAPNDGPAATAPDGSAQGVSTAVTAPAPATSEKKGTISQRLTAAGKTAVIGKSVDFKLLKQALETEDPRMHHAARLTLGVDKDGDRLDQALTLEAAVERAGLGKNRSELSKVLKALGLTLDVRNRFINSTAQANERAEGDIGEDADVGQFQAEYIDESEATGSRQLAESDNAGAGAAAEDFGRAGEQQSAGGISSAGGSQGRTNSGKNLPLLINRKSYRPVREKGLAGLTDEELATLIADADSYNDSDRSEDKAARNAIWAEAIRRQSKPGFAAAVNRAYTARQQLTETKKTGKEATDNNVIENDENGEPLVTLSEQEQALLLEATGKLTQEEQTALEDHYGGSLESAEVQGKLADDVLAHTDGKKPKLPEVIRKIIAKLAKAIAAVAVFFNVSGLNPQTTSDAYARTVASMPAQVTVTQAEQRASEQADTDGRELSPNAQTVANWVAENAEPNEISLILDPASGTLYVMKGGKVVADSPALYGAKGVGSFPGGSMEAAAKADLPTEEKKVTPAGRFSLEFTQNDPDYGTSITFAQTGDYRLAVHRVYQGNPAERRAERLKSGRSDDKMVSFGCINVSDAFYDEVLKKFDYSGKAFAYLLPSDASKLGQFFDLGSNNRAPAPTRTASTGQKFGTRRKTAKGPTYTKAELETEVKAFVRVDALGRSINIVEDVNELLNSPLDDIRKIGEALRDPSKYGIYANNRVWIIANRIEKGNGRAAFMHEVGVHLGLERLLPKATFNSLVDKVIGWADKNDDSQESKIARAALARVPPSTPDEDVKSEVLAYFVEEALKAGIDPTAQTQRGNAELRSWFTRLWAAFKTALLRLGFKPDAFTAQDIVNLAFGAARLEAAGTWHGTAADFKNFLHKYMNSGEGAQAYGWGTYLAQRYGIGKGYFEADVRRKTVDEKTSVKYNGVEAGYIKDSGLNGAVVSVMDHIRIGKTLQQAIETVVGNLGRRVDSIQKSVDSARRNNLPGLRDLEESLEWNKEDLETAKGLDPAKFEVTHQKRNAPDGSLMRVDVSVADNETLDWDAPLSKQPQVVRDFVALNFPGEEKRIKTGGDLYKMLIAREWETLRQRGWLNSSSWDRAGANERLQVKELASEALDAAGVKALKFLDSSSRDPNSPEGERTRNLVVFNDKNIHRVATLTGADRQRTKFGTAATADGSYEATRARFDALNKALPPSARTATSNIATIIKTAMSGIANRVVFTHDLIDRAARVGLASAADFGRLYKERAQMTNGLSGRVDDVARLYSAVPDAERGRGPGTVNDFLKDSTRTDAWGFMPDWLPEAKRANVKVDPAMANRFNALSPQSQAYARAVFEHGYKTLELKKRTILNATVSEYDALITAAKDAGDNAEVARLESDKSKAQAKFDSLFKTNGESPYAPLKRFGNWVVIAESTALRQARLDDDKKRIAELEQDGKHYYVDFYESHMEALNAERQLRATGNYDISAEGVAVRKKEEARDRLYGGDGMAAAFTKLRNQARMRLEGEQDASKRALLEMATDMYLSALAESSARKGEMRRRGIEGDIDMLRSFVAQGYADAHMVSALAFSGTQGDAINAMRREKETGSSADQTRKSQAFNEIVKRHADSMEYVEPNAIDGIKTAASIYYLAFSPAYYLQNLTQPWMVSLPIIAGRHDYGKTAAAIGKAGSELKDAWLGSGLSQAIDLSKVPADVREAMTTLYERGILTSGLNLEFKNARASDATGAYGRTKQALGDVKDFVNDVQTKVEVMNRTATAIAAYRLELSKGASPAEALKYADDIVRQTHGDYSMMAAPRFFNSNFGKLALQFRKYQLLQLSLMARLIRESFTGTDRSAARWALGFVLAQTGLLAGAMGLPGFTAIAWILSKMFGDPDEPDDPEYKLRKAIGNKEVADLLLKGLPNLFGADLSNKIGWQNMLSPLPYTDIDLTKKSVTEIGFALTLGASGAMAGKVVDGLASMKDGRYVEGLTKAMPTGFGNAIKGANTFLDGVRNKDGEVLLTRDEINMAEAVLMGIGLTPTDIASQQFRQRVNYEATTNFADRASKIKQEFVNATREGAGRQDAIDAWKKLQDTRVANGFKRQPEQELYDAVKEAKKQERNTINGVQFRTTNRPFVETLGQI